MQITGLDHISIHVADVQQSMNFYRDVMGLAEVQRPDFNFQGAWFSLGNGQTLHLIEGRTIQPHWGSRATHIAFAVLNIAMAASYYEQKGITHTPIKERPDGIKQFFITDPDGYCLEICEAATV